MRLNPIFLKDEISSARSFTLPALVTLVNGSLSVLVISNLFFISKSARICHSMKGFSSKTKLKNRPGHFTLSRGRESHDSHMLVIQARPRCRRLKNTGIMKRLLKL